MPRTNYCVIVFFLLFFLQVTLKVPVQKERRGIVAQRVIHLKGRLLPGDRRITPAGTCAINPQLSDFKMEKHGASGEENALKST